MEDDEKSRVLLTQGDSVPNTPAQSTKPVNSKPEERGDASELTEQQKLDIIANQLSQAFGETPPIPPPGARGDAGDNLKDADSTGYVAPINDPYRRAITYLEQHNILQVFQYITSGIVYKRPDDPIDFMINECAKLKEKRDSGSDMILDIVKQKSQTDS